MNITTNLRSLIKTLPLVSVMAVGLALSPSVSMASKSDHDYHAEKNSHHNKSHRNKQGEVNQHRKTYGDRHGHGNGYFTKYRGRDHHFNKHIRSHKIHSRGHRPGYRHGHRHNHKKHNYYVINEHRGHEHYHRIDPLRFMIGLHTDNVDIIFSD